MSLSDEALKSGASQIRELVEKVGELSSKLAAEQELQDAIETIQTLVKAGRLEDTDESIVKRAHAFLISDNRQELTKQAKNGNIHIDMNMFGDLEIGSPAKKEASRSNVTEIDTEHNTFHKELLSGQ